MITLKGWELRTWNLGQMFEINFWMIGPKTWWFYVLCCRLLKKSCPVNTSVQSMPAKKSCPLTKFCPVNASVSIQCKSSSGFQTCHFICYHFACNFCCFLFRIMPENVFKIWRAAIWFGCAFQLERPFLRQVIDLDLLACRGLQWLRPNQKRPVFVLACSTRPSCVGEVGITAPRAQPFILQSR